MIDITREAPRRQMVKRLNSLRNEFSTWKGGLEDLFEHLNPLLARWNRSDFNKGGKKYGTIINNTPLLAGRVLASGFMAAVTSPMREWFRQTAPDPELGERPNVKAYLHHVEERQRWALQMGTFYQGLADGIYPCLGVAGFSAGLLEEHARRIITLRPWAIGEFYLSANGEGRIDTSYRETPMTVRQLVGQLLRKPGTRDIDWSGASTVVKNLWDNGGYDTVVDVVHVIQPNDEMDPGALGPRSMAWGSCWFEAKGNEEKFLKRSGYREFPVLSPRWSVIDGETYGRGPGTQVLGDAKQLQHHERALARLIDMSAKPPMVADEQLRGNRLSLVPGDVVYAPRGQGDGFKAAVQVDAAAIVNVLQHIERCEKRIDRGMFADLFARILRDERSQRATATEIEEMSREVASQVGPALERLDSELFSPTLDRVYGILERRGFLMEPPEEMQGTEIKAEFISVMHQAQKGVGLQPIRVFIGEVGNLAALRPDVLDKLNADEVVDEIAKATGVKPNLVLADEEVAKVRQVRAARQQAMEQGQAMLAAAKGAKDLGTTPAPAPDNALGALPALLANGPGQLSPSQATGAANAPLGPLAQGGFPQPGARA